jgi:hypothetical protein
MIITSLEDAKKLKPGQPCEIILAGDDGDPGEFLELQPQYDAIAKAINEVHKFKSKLKEK